MNLFSKKNSKSINKTSKSTNKKIKKSKYQKLEDNQSELDINEVNNNIDEYDNESFINDDDLDSGDESSYSKLKSISDYDTSFKDYDDVKVSKIAKKQDLNEPNQIVMKSSNSITPFILGLLTSATIFGLAIVIPKLIIQTIDVSSNNTITMDVESVQNAKAIIDYYKNINLERGAFISTTDDSVYLVVADKTYKILSQDETSSLFAVNEDGEVEDLTDVLQDKDNPVEIVVKDNPDDANSKIYHIKWGDTLCKLASKYNFSISELADYNNISNVHLIYAGHDLKIPSGTTKMTPEEIEQDNKKHYESWSKMKK